MKWNKTTRVDSSDKNVSKYVFTTDNAVAEAVLYKYPTYNDRTVVCCSTQSGCPVGCRFCGTGEYFVRSLTTEEIVDQTVHMFSDRGIDPDQVKRMQIMFMSMGEPMLNVDALIEAMRELHLLYPEAALLISTSAPTVPEAYRKIREVSQQIPTIGLQFSVHESTDEARNALIPFKNKLTLKEIATEGEEWYRATGRHPFFNYCVHPENNKAEDVDRLLALFNPHIWEATLSVICEKTESVAAANERQRKLATDFQLKMAQAGFSTRTFDPAGQDDIGGGCGQLWYVQDWMRGNPQHTRKSIGYGRPSVHTPREEAYV